MAHSNQPEEIAMNTQTVQRPASDKQITFGVKLYRELFEYLATRPGTALVDVDAALIDVRTSIEKSSMREASEMIDQMIELNRKNRSEAKAKTAAAKETVDDGFYEKDGTVYKIQWNLSHSRKYAKELHPQGETRADRWVYVGRRPLDFLTPANKLTLERGKELGRLYGICCCCGATLTNETSIELGIGPVCGGRL